MVNVERLKPYVPRIDAPPPPGPVSDPGQEGEHEVEVLLNHRDRRAGREYLVRWRGHTSVEDEWVPLARLSNCKELVAEYEAAAPRRRAAQPAGRAASAGLGCLLR